MSPRVRWGGAALTILLYVGALVLPVANPLPVGVQWLGDTRGHHVLTAGFQVLDSIPIADWNSNDVSLMVGWSANFLIWVLPATFATNRLTAACWISLPTTALTLSVLPVWWDEIYLQPGYWCWCLSAATGWLAWLWARRGVAADLAADYGPAGS